ncbi:MAG: hypothetical protein RLZ11_977 [Bacteroidota bacterium]
MKYLLLSATAFLITIFGNAQWNPNTSVNLQVSAFPVSDMQSLTTSTGRTWIAFYHENNGNYDMRAQLLDVDGTKLLGADGMLVDNKPSGTATFVFNICKDADDNLIVAYQDQRSGQLAAVAYKVSQTGTHLWSSSGVVIGQGLAPYPAVLSTGETVVAWNESTTNTLQIQKIATNGTLAWSTPVSVLVGTSLTTRGQLVPNLNGAFTMVFQRRGFGIATTLYAQRYTSSGSAVWPAAVQLSTETTSGARYYSVTGEADVTYCGYYSAQGSRFNSWLHRINADGTLPYGGNGSNFSIATSSSDPYQQMTNIALNPGSPYVWSVCSYSNTSQSQYGVYVQKFLKETGARLLSNTAQNIYPISTSFDTQAGNVSLVDDAPMFMSYDANYKIYVTRLDGNGAFVWSGNRIEISSTTAGAGSPKGRFNFSGLSNNQAVGVWAETRNGIQNAYAQNILPGGLTPTPIVITTQPSSQTVCEGTGANFSVTATGTGITYQWEQSTNGCTGPWSAISGATSATYSISSTSGSLNNTAYRCVLSASGTSSVTSNCGLLTVAGPITVSSQPISQTVCSGAAITFTTVASGVSLTYQWQINTGSGFTNLSNGGVYSGVTTASLGISAATITLNNYQYRCVISNAACNVNSASATLTVNPITTIAQQPNAQTICAGSTVSFSVTATGASITYQWQQSLNGCNGPWTTITGATSATYTIANASVSLDNTAYRCIVNGTCTAALTSGCGLLTVVAPTTVTTQPISQTVCDGAGVTFTTAGSGAGVIYQWQVNTGSGFTNLANGGIYSGVTTGSLAISTTNPAMSGYQYRCVLSNAVCTSPVNTNTITLTVNTLPAISSQPQAQTTCSGTTVSFTVGASGTGVQYQWQVNTGTGFVNLTNTGNYTGATASTLVVSNTTVTMSGYQYRCVVSGTCTPAVNSAAVALTVYAPVVVNRSPANAEVCVGATASFLVAASSVPAINYQWQVSTNGGTTWTDIAGATTTSLSLPSVIIAMNGNRYRCLVSSNTCSTPVASAAALLTVRVVPTVTLTAAPYTSLLPGQSTTLTATTSTSTGGVISTNWTQNSQPYTPSSSLSNVSGINDLGVYQVGIRETWPSGLFCSALSQTVTITANVSNRLFIFPSPNDGNFTVSYYYGQATSATRQLNIYDGKGALVYRESFSVAGPYTLLPVDLRQHARGIYYIVIGDAAGNKLIQGKVHVR